MKKLVLFSDLFLDLVSCLENLGYPNKTSQEICTRVMNENKEKELEFLIPIALKYLTKPRVSDEWKKLRFKSSWKT